MKKLPLPIGIEFYKKMMDTPYYYVDKTMMIKELLDKGGVVNLFTRPRRFGKTLLQSMLRVFLRRKQILTAELLIIVITSMEQRFNGQAEDIWIIWGSIR